MRAWLMNEGKASLMNCMEFDAIAPDLGRSGAVSRERCADALAHAEACDRCAALLTEMESLEFAFRTMGAQDAERMAPARVEAVLLNEIRRTRNSPARAARNWRLAGAAAAGLLLAAGISLRQKLLHPAAPRTEAPGSLIAESSTVAVAPSGAGSLAESGAKTHVNSNPGVATVATKPGAASEGAFLALPYADDPDTLEGGAIVRVNLSRAALGRPRQQRSR